MSELTEATGRGKKYKIGDEEFEVMPATLFELEEVADLYNESVSPLIVANFVGEDKQKKTEALYQVLGKAFRNTVPIEKLKKLNRVEVKEIINFFLVD